MSLFSARRRYPIWALAVSLVFAPAMFADVLEFNPFLPPAQGSYAVPDTCVSVVCLENISLGNFRMTTSMIVGGNETTESTADLTATIFQNVAGAPGKFISPVVLTGPVDITYFSKNTLSESGTFNTEITVLDLTGSFVGLTGPHQIAAGLNPLFDSTGKTTVTPVLGSPGTWEVGSFFDVFAEIQVDNGNFVPGPERMGDLTALPEPAYFAAIGALMAVMLLKRAVRSKSRLS